MKGTIYKFPIPDHPADFSIMMRSGMPLYVGVDQKDGKPYLWASVELEEEETEVKFKIIGTGSLVDTQEEWLYVGTWQQGPFVWHLITIDD